MYKLKFQSKNIKKHLEVAEELLCNVQRIAEIFWETKGVGSIKIKSFYPTGSDMVYPKTS